ncbi:MAG: hypothetical protein M3524_12650, partial [Actinomycetota bacterium]|nr:hypothetical protein [Actinomycetota bacterium]
ISAPLTAVTEVDTTSSEYVRLRINGRFRAAPGLEQRNLNTLPGQCCRSRRLTTMASLSVQT